MRNAFADEMTRLAQSRSDVVMLSGDIGNKLFDKFKDAAADRFFNCGVAEANMMSVAGGMAMNGLRPVVYTITPFITTRCLEQIRNDVCYHDVPVVIVGVGSGLGYASLGPTHHSCEDLALLRVMPNMNVVAPADAWEVRALLNAALAQDRPTYMRIGKKGEPLVHASRPSLEIGRSFCLRSGKDVTLLCAGTLMPQALQTAKLLDAAGISTAVFSMHTIKPLDETLLNHLFQDRKLVVTIEEHSRIGGLGSAVAEWRADHIDSGARLLRFGTPDEFLHYSGEQQHALVSCGLTAEAMSNQIREVWAKTKN